MNLRLIYPKFPFWRAEVIRLPLYLAGIEFENHHPSREEFSTLRSEGGLPFGQVPVLVVDGETIAQTGAIARYCGKLSGFYPTDALAAAKVDQFIDAATDVTNLFYATMREKDNTAKMAARKAIADGPLTRWLGYFETLLSQSTTDFFVGPTMTIADIAIWRLLGWLKSGNLDGIPVEIVDGFHALEAHYARMDAHPKIRTWMEENYG
jgi:glutathione S-transferase